MAISAFNVPPLRCVAAFSLSCQQCAVMFPNPMDSGSPITGEPLLPLDCPSLWCQIFPQIQRGLEYLKGFLSFKDEEHLQKQGDTICNYSAILLATYF